MFYHVTIQQSIDLEPMFFGRQLRDTISLKITDKVGTAVGTGCWQPPDASLYSDMHYPSARACQQRCASTAHLSYQHDTAAA
jgi:hypothetical protein